MVRSNKDLLDYLSRIYSFPTANIEMLKFAPGDQLIRQGAKVRAVYIIKKGLAKCYLQEDNGKYFVQEFFGEGEICGEVEAIKETLSFCYITAITQLDGYKIKVEHFHELLQNDQRFNFMILKALATKIKYKAERHAYNQSHTAEDNLSRLHYSFPEWIHYIPKQDIANYLGITLRSLNRIISKHLTK